MLPIPTVPVGVLLGEWVHDRVDERSLKVAVLVLVAAAAISLVVRYSAQLI